MEYPEALCYPSSNPKCVKERMSELINCGVKEILNDGKLLIGDWRVLGKGHSAVIFKAKLNDGRITAVKVLRSDSKRSDLLLECSLAAKGYPITPRIYCCSKHLIVMELINGLLLEEIFNKETLSCEEALSIVLKAFEAVSFLDRVGIDHKELSRPTRHIFITRRGEIKVIDFETASGGPAKNLLRVFSWFIIRSWFGRVCCNKIKSHLNEVVLSLRKYDVEPRKAFREIVNQVINGCSSSKDKYS